MGSILEDKGSFIIYGARGGAALVGVGNLRVWGRIYFKLSFSYFFQCLAILDILECLIKMIRNSFRVDYESPPFPINNEASLI